MHQSCTLPKLSSPVSCLLILDPHGSHYGAYTEANTSGVFNVALKAGNSVGKGISDALSIGRTGLSVEAEESDWLPTAAEEIGGHDLHRKGASAAQDKVGDFYEKVFMSCAQCFQGHENSLAASHENCEVVVELSTDMPIVGSASAEVHMDVLAAEFPQGDKSSVNGCTSLKRRSQRDLEEARAEKRVKLDTCHGDELTKEEDVFVPFVQGDENSTAVGNGTDLTDLLKDLGDSEDDDDDGFGGDFLSTAGLFEEYLGNSIVKETEVLAQIPLVEPIVNNPANVSAKLETSESIGTEVEANPPQGEANPPQGEANPPHAEANPPQAEANPPHAEANPPQAEANPPHAEANPPQAEAYPPHTEAYPPHAEANPPPTETIIKAVDVSSEVEERDDIGIKVQDHAQQTEPIINSVDISSEVEKRDSIGTMVQAHALETVGKEKSLPEIITLDSDSDDDVDDDELVMFASLDESPQLQNAVDSGSGGLSQVPHRSFQPANAVIQAPGVSRQVLNGSPRVENPVKVEHGTTMQVLNGTPQVGNTVMVEHGSTRQVPNGNDQVGAHVKVEHGNTRQLPNGSPHVEYSVKVEHGSTRQVPHTAEPRQNPSLHAGIVQAPPGGTVQMRIENGKLVPYIKYPVTQQNLSRMSMTPFGGNIMHPAIRQAYNFSHGHPSGGPTSFTPNNGYAQETTSGQQIGRSHGLNAPTTSAAETSSRDQPGLNHRWNPSAASTTAPTSGDQAGPSQRWNPSAVSTAAPTSGDQAGPSQRWNPPNSSAVVPYTGGANKAEPGLYDTTNLGPQNVSAHNQLAVVKPHYDSTVSTPRIDVARAMQHYDYYITKAKNDKAREALARTEATPNEFAKEGQKRGLDRRPDIVAYNEMKRDGGDVNRGIIVGDLPGVEVGDRFSYRHQMAVVGLHRLPNVGIDYGYPPPEMIPTATAIVLMPKAGYVDDKDYGNVILYTGQGGRKKRNQGAPFVCDQELKKGNLALVKNYERKLPVRLIRGHSGLSNSGPGALGYTYDGLYIITKYEFSMGMNGFNVFKYSMERLGGQPPIPPCIGGCTAHEWNTAQGALGAVPLQVVDPGPVEEDVKQLCI